MTGLCVSVAGFAALLMAGAALEVAARHGSGTASGPRTLAAAMRTTSGRVVVLAAWLWSGVHFLAR